MCYVSLRQGALCRLFRYIKEGGQLVRLTIAYALTPTLLQYYEVIESVKRRLST